LIGSVFAFVSESQAGDHRIYALGQSLGRLEGQVEALAQSLQREHDERIAAMKAHEQRADATDRRVEEILDRLAEQIAKVGMAVDREHSQVETLKDSRSNSISATRWFVGIGVTIALSGAAMYGSYRGSEPAKNLCPQTIPPQATTQQRR
jgi:hypothetical protein